MIIKRMRIEISPLVVLNVVGSSPILHPSKGVSRALSPFFVSPRFFFFTRPILFLRLVCDPPRSPKHPLPSFRYGGWSKGCRWRGAMGRRLTGALCFSSLFVLLRPHDHSTNKVVTGADIPLPRFFIVR